MEGNSASPFRKYCHSLKVPHAEMIFVNEDKSLLLFFFFIHFSHLTLENMA